MWAYVEIKWRLPADEFFDVNCHGPRTLLAMDRITNNTKLSTIKQTYYYIYCGISRVQLALYKLYYNDDIY